MSFDENSLPQGVIDQLGPVMDAYDALNPDESLAVDKMDAEEAVTVTHVPLSLTQKQPKQPTAKKRPAPKQSKLAVVATVKQYNRDNIPTFILGRHRLEGFRLYEDPEYIGKMIFEADFGHSELPFGFTARTLSIAFGVHASRQTVLLEPIKLPPEDSKGMSPSASIGFIESQRESLLELLGGCERMAGIALMKKDDGAVFRFPRVFLNCKMVTVVTDPLNPIGTKRSYPVSDLAGLYKNAGISGILAVTKIARGNRGRYDCMLQAAITDLVIYNCQVKVPLAALRPITFEQPATSMGKKAKSGDGPVPMTEVNETLLVKAW